MARSGEGDLAVHPSWGRRLVGIEGLRGIAALCVLVHHVTIRLADPDRIGGFAKVGDWLTHGLTLFFVLSGFLLFRPFAASMAEGRPLPSIRKYARNRFLRIYPAYLVILLLVGLVFGAAYTEGPPQGGTVEIGYLTDPLTLLADALIIHAYIPQTMLTGIGPSWSLVPEVAFYVVLPLLVLVCARLARWGRALAAVLVAPVVLVVVGWTTTLYLDSRTEGMSGAEMFQYLWGHHWSAVLARSLLAQADLFGYGMVAAVIVIALGRWGVTRVPWVVPAVLLLGAAWVTWAALEGPLESHSRRFIGMAAAVLVLAVALPSSSGAANGIARTLEVRPLRLLGLISYSVYLWHVPVLFWLDRHGLGFAADAGGLLANIASVTVVTVVLSCLTFWLVERPALNAKKGIGPVPRERPAEPASPLASSGARR